jgi:Fic family protein
MFEMKKIYNRLVYNRLVMKNLPKPSKLRFLDNFDVDLQQAILRQIQILWTHHSTAIEGNTLSLGDTKFIIEEGLTIAGKTIKEHNEVMGHVRAIDIIYLMLDKPFILEEDLFKLHTAIQTDIVWDVYNPVGNWKKEINGVNILIENKMIFREFPHPNHIPYLMTLWLKKFGCFSERLSLDQLIELYAAMHITFVCIHPFFDGNGRIARLIANIPILKSGFPPIIITKENRKRYLQILSLYQFNSPQLDNNTLDLLDYDNQYFKEFILFCKEEYQGIREIIENMKIIQDKRLKR